MHVGQSDSVWSRDDTYTSEKVWYLTFEWFRHRTFRNF